MAAEFLRDTLMTAAIFGVFAMSWFGWAQEAPPSRWRPFLAAGSVVGLLLGAGMGIVAGLNWDAPSALRIDGRAEAFGVVVGIEVALCLGGALVLMRRGHADLASPWVAAVVGLHFIPLALIFNDPSLYVLSALMTVGAVVGTVLARRHGVTPSAVVGAISGSLLLAFAAGAAIRGLLRLA